ncbi:hypothetical protein N7507_003981 [Penicillium longicatenatum]|nr:hypothetical protein N7507_003981 [Penicillium longicatenatum]
MSLPASVDLSSVQRWRNSSSTDSKAREQWPSQLRSHLPGTKSRSSQAVENYQQLRKADKTLSDEAYRQVHDGDAPSPEFQEEMRQLNDEDPPSTPETASLVSFQISKTSFNTYEMSGKKRRPHHSRSRAESTHSTGSQVSDASVEPGYSVFHAIVYLIEENLKAKFLRPRLIRSTKPCAKESCRLAIMALLHNVHKRYDLLDEIAVTSRAQRNDDLVELYDDMKLAFKDFTSLSVYRKGSDEFYTHFTSEISEFGFRLDQCMGLNLDEGVVSPGGQGSHPIRQSQLALDRSKYENAKAKMIAKAEQYWNVCLIEPNSFIVADANAA